MKSKTAISSAAGLMAFLLLAWASLGWGGAFDDACRYFLYDLRNDPLTVVMLVITKSADWQPLLFVCLLTTILPAFRRTIGLPLSAMTLISYSLQELLKLVFQRLRPADILPLVSETSFSFPSGHSMTGFVFYFTLFFLIGKATKKRTASLFLTVLALVWIGLIGISRIYLGVHYPTDVLAGWSLGFVLVACFKYAAHRFAGEDIRN